MEEEVKKKQSIKETDQDLYQMPLERIFKDAVSSKQNANKGCSFFGSSKVTSPGVSTI